MSQYHLAGHTRSTAITNATETEARGHDTHFIHQPQTRHPGTAVASDLLEAEILLVDPGGGDSQAFQDGSSAVHHRLRPALEDFPACNIRAHLQHKPLSQPEKLQGRLESWSSFGNLPARSWLPSACL